MPALLIGGLWLVLIVCLLSRLVRQAQAHRASALEPLPAAAPAPPDVAVILPVRDEIANIEACLAGLLAQQGLGRGYEIVVVDDNSGDGTAERVARIAEREPRLRLVRAAPLPPGWMGKPHACWHGAAAATGARWLCFVDADLRAAPRLIATAVAAAERHGIDMLSLSPFQELGGFWERLILPAGLLLIACAMDLRRIDDPADPEVTANGQFLLFRRAAYVAVEGHAAVRHEICEDKALARLVKQRGWRFRLMDGERLASTRMYTDLASLWEGLAKNAVDILGSRAASVAVATAGVVLGWMALAFPLWSGIRFAGGPAAMPGATFGLCLLGSLIVFGVHLGTARHYRIPAWFGFLFPAAYSAVAALAWCSLWRRWSGRVRWKGRTYDLSRKTPRRLG